MIHTQNLILKKISTYVTITALLMGNTLSFSGQNDHKINDPQNTTRRAQEALEPNTSDKKLKKPLRARYFIEKGVEKRWQGLLKLEPELRNQGLIFVQENPDVLLCNKITKEIKELNKPIIVLEKRGSASLSRKSRTYLSDPQVKAIFKNRILKNPLDDNEKQAACSHSLTLLNKQVKIVDLTYEKLLQSDDIHKIRCVLWDFSGSALSERFIPLEKYEFNLNDERPLDVFFAGNISYEKATESINALYMYHRTQAIDAINNISGIKALTLSGRHLPFDEYIETMKKSKIVVSPWGFGEWCYRDVEAIHCGALVIKPNTNFINAIPNIYQNNKTYIPCKLDFSDLESIVKDILEHPDTYDHIRIRAKKIVNKLRANLDSLAADFVNNITQALGDM